MSHFAVLVLSKSVHQVEELLLPYMENSAGEPPFEYMEFYEDDAFSIEVE